MKLESFKFISKNIENLAKITFTLGRLGKVDKEKMYFDEQFNEFLKLEDCLFCYKMIDQGYKASKLTIGELNTILINKLDNNKYEYTEINNIKNLDIRIKIISMLKNISTNNLLAQFSEYRTEDSREQIVLNLLKDKESKEKFVNYLTKSIDELEKYYVGGLDCTGDFYNRKAEETLKVTKHTNSLIYVVSTLIKDNFLTPVEVDTIKNMFKNFIVLIEKITRESYKSSSFSKIDKYSIDNFIESLTIYQEKNLNKDNKKENLLRQLNSYNFRNNTLEDKIKDLIIKEDYSIEKLPKEVKEKIEKINILVKILKNDEVKTFLNERLPSILKKYFSIDEEYRTILKNVEGYNAQELMFQSLENIERIIISKKEDNNYDLLSDLSIENRSLKMKIVR